MKKPNDVLTTGEISEICRCASRTVTRWIDTGVLKGFRIPGSTARRVVLAQLFLFMREKGLPIEWLSRVANVQEVESYCDMGKSNVSVSDIKPSNISFSKSVGDIIVITAKDQFGKEITINKRPGTRSPMLNIAIGEDRVGLRQEHISALLPIFSFFLETGELPECLK